MYTRSYAIKALIYIWIDRKSSRKEQLPELTELLLLLLLLNLNSVKLSELEAGAVGLYLTLSFKII